jgi:putative phosphoesterase
MRIIIMSDSHGEMNTIEEVLTRHEHDHVFHLGDAEISKDLFNMRMIKGNSYNDDDLPLEILVEIDGIKFFLTHGHLYDVYNGLSKLFYKGKSLNADYCLYGHTHITNYVKYEDVTLINPGSLSRPRDGFSSYMVLDTLTKKCTLYNLLGKEIQTYE